MKIAKVMALVLAAALVFGAMLPLNAMAESSGTWSTVTPAGDNLSIHMVQGDFAANLEVNGVIDYEFIDNTGSVAEYYEPTFDDDGFITMEFANTHFITISNEASLTFIDYEYSHTEEDNLRFYEFGNPVVSGFEPIKYEILYFIPLRPGWTFEFADNTVEMSEAFLLYNRATDGGKAEAFIFHMADKKPDDTPPLSRNPRTANGTQGVMDHSVGRAPVQNFYGELALDGRMSFEVPGTGYIYENDRELTYSLFITEDGTLDIDFWVQYGGDADYAASRDVTFYDYAPVINGTDVVFEIIDTTPLTDEPFTYQASVSGFFLAAGTSASKSGDEIFAEFLVGIALSEAQTEEYLRTGTIAAYPDFDWSVLGAHADADEKNNTALWLIIGGVIAALGAAAVFAFMRRKKAG